MKTSDISDEVMMAAVRAVRGQHGAAGWSSLWDVQKQLADIHPKLVLSKLKSMIRRKLLTGCACGCRGDFEEPV